VFRTNLLYLIAVAALAQQNDPSYKPLQQAYDALRQKAYERAIAGFQQAIALAPDKPAIHKDLAYTLLKIGDTEAARDQFSEAVRLDPSDDHVAMEYAFLCYETKQQATARIIFDRIRKNGNATAEDAFQNIDRPLAEGIARWSKAVTLEPGNFSAHQELATLAEQRDELEVAAEHYEKAWRLRPDERALLLDLGRVWKQLGRAEDANIALIAASRGAQPRVAEKARELLPARYPYVYEFEKALDLDPKNTDLRRELAYLLLEMDKKQEAERQFQIVNQSAPDDLLTAAQLGFLRLKRRDMAGAQPLLDQVLKSGDDELADRVRVALNLPQTLHRRSDTSRDQVGSEAKALAEKSLKAGYLKDALKYLNVAHEADPVDFGTMLKLGWVYNILHDDSQAIEWFNMARKSPDPAVSSEAAKAFQNLRPGLARSRTTAWMYPFFSTRWHDAFGYGQVKTELKLGNLPLRPYVSTRFIGDVRQTTGSTLSNAQPQYLSESSVIFGFGLATNTWRGLTGWAEAGEAVKYITSRKDAGAAIPDYRGGISYAKGLGHLLNSGKGFFAETNDDGIFVSRFQKDMFLYAQNRGGYTLSPTVQFFWNFNATVDRLGQYWANYIETGPGFRFRLQAMPRSMLFSVNFLRGVYTVNAGNPRRPNFWDVRAGFWYAFTR
jgi:Tfp pilus assembly protein PilF